MRNHWESRYQGERDKVARAFATLLDDRAAFAERPAAVALIALERAVPSMLDTEEVSLCSKGSQQRDVQEMLDRLDARAAAVPSPPLTPGAVEIHFPTLVARHLTRAVAAPLITGSPRGMARAEAIEAMTDTVYYVAVQIAVRESPSTRFVRLPNISQDVFLRAFKRVFDAAESVSIEEINTSCNVTVKRGGVLAIAAIAMIVGVAGAITVATRSSRRSAA